MRPQKRIRSQKSFIHQRLRTRGVAAVETALSLLIVLFVAMGGIHLSYAMFVRQRLTSIASKTARFCSVHAGQQVNGGNAEACATQMGNNELTPLLQGRTCETVTVNPVVSNVSNVEILTVNINCAYTGGPWAGFVNDQMVRNGQSPLTLTLRAQSSMPLFP